MEAYVHGVSTRAVDELVAALGVSSGVSKSEVSRICAQLDEVVQSVHRSRWPLLYGMLVGVDPDDDCHEFLLRGRLETARALLV
jgi:hypothetical protein